MSLINKRNLTLMTTMAIMAVVLLAALAFWLGSSSVNAQSSPDPNRPSRPDVLQITTEQGSNTVFISWKAVYGAEDYKIQWREAVQGSQLNRGIQVDSPGAYIVVSDYGKWVVRVVACNGGRCSLPRSGRFQTVPEGWVPTPEPDPIPGDVTGLDITTSLNSRNLIVNWDSVEFANEYTLEWWISNHEIDPDNNTKTTDAFANIDVSSYDHWDVSVKACNDSGCGRATIQTVSVETDSRPPDINTGSDAYRFFNDFARAPRGFVLSRNFEGIFSDPDGDALTYSLEITGVPDEVALDADIHGLRVWYQYTGEEHWYDIEPIMNDPLISTVYVTATDPYGLSATIEGWYYTHWGAHWYVHQLPTGDVPEIPTVAPGTPSSLTITDRTENLTVLADWADVDWTSVYKVKWRLVGGEFETDNTVRTVYSNQIITFSEAGEWEVQVESCNSVGCSSIVSATHTVTESESESE